MSRTLFRQQQEKEAFVFCHLWTTQRIKVQRRTLPHYFSFQEQLMIPIQPNYEFPFINTLYEGRMGRPYFLRGNNISACICSGLRSNTICKAGIFSHSFLLYKTINPLQPISLIVECKLPIKDLRVREDTYQTGITHALIPAMLSTMQF